MSALEFHAITLDDRELVERYMSEYGESSCQHAFVSMYALAEKYGDAICEKDGVLFVLRANLCDEAYRVYLAPMGKGDLKDALTAIADDAHRYGRKVKYYTLTPRYAELLRESFPDAYTIEGRRDLAEYFYSTERLSTFSGLAMKQKRKELHQFLGAYGERLTFSDITEDDIPEVLAYEEQWVEVNRESHDEDALLREQRCICRVLEKRQELGITGSVMRVDGRVCGFFLGFRLNDTCYDGMFEKCDKSLRFSYRAMMNEVGRHCVKGYTYVNIEEDLGIEGLRNMKLAYHPAFLLEKYIALEK